MTKLRYIVRIVQDHHDPGVGDSVTSGWTVALGVIWMSSNIYMDVLLNQSLMQTKAVEFWHFTVIFGSLFLGISMTERGDASVQHGSSRSSSSSVSAAIVHHIKSQHNGFNLDLLVLHSLGLDQESG